MFVLWSRWETCISWVYRCAGMMYARAWIKEEGSICDCAAEQCTLFLCPPLADLPSIILGLSLGHVRLPCNRSFLHWPTHCLSWNFYANLCSLSGQGVRPLEITSRWVTPSPLQPHHVTQAVSLHRPGSLTALLPCPSWPPWKLLTCPLPSSRWHFTIMEHL